MRLNGAPVLVTGAGGFIGSHLAEALVRAGAKTRALVHYDARGDWGHLASLPNDVLRDIEVISGDVRDRVFMREMIRDWCWQASRCSLGALPVVKRTSCDAAASTAAATSWTCAMAWLPMSP